MKYVESIATKMGKKTEYVDSSLTEVFLSDSQYVKKLSYRSCIAEVISLSLLLLPKVGIPVIGILAKGLLFLSHLLPKSVVLLIIWIVILASIGTFIGTPIVTFVKFLFSKRGINNSFRDPKVIERARELIERGYNVLIVRGSYHKDFIIRGLQKYSIDCKIVKVIHNNIGYLISRIRIAFYSTVLQLRWCAYLGLLVRRHFKQKRRHRTSKAHEPFGR
ncbi:MAG: hypothetical protein RQ853_05790 [Acidianus sp.]|jgi:hypothetical protein|nr:hypothetical protein [Acidianus sp.]